MKKLYRKMDKAHSFVFAMKSLSVDSLSLNFVADLSFPFLWIAGRRKKGGGVGQCDTVFHMYISFLEYLQ